MEHKDIPDNQLHETKGAAVALTGQVLVANGAGGSSFRFLTADDISGIGASGYSVALSSFSTAATQNPTALDTPLQVSFGGAVTGPDVSMTDTGTITFNQAGNYVLTLFLRFGRTSGAGTAVLLNRILLNDVQYLRTNAIALTDTAATIPFSTTLHLTVTAGTTLKFQIARDSSGINNGGLVRTSPTSLPWNISPSASLVIYKEST